MFSGYENMVTLDNGSTNMFGKFPVVQCSGMDLMPTCHKSGFSEKIKSRRGLYCVAEVHPNPLDPSESKPLNLLTPYSLPVD
jgi:hypothetical protein